MGSYKVITHTLVVYDVLLIMAQKCSFAFALHTHFVTDDAAAENIATLRRTHSFMPYRTVATILKFSNPIAMVKMMLDLFMAQPLGGKSLFQR